MAGEEDRTEAATPRRLQKAREEGQVAMSRELSSLAVLGGTALILTMVMPAATRRMVAQMATLLGNAHQLDMSDNGAAVLHQAGVAVLRMAAPFVLTAMVAGSAAILLQTGFLLNLSKLQPDLSRLSLLRGLKKIGGVASLVETAKSIAKVGVVSAVCWHTLSADLATLSLSPLWEPATLAEKLTRLALRLLLSVVACQAVIAVLDVGWTRFRHARDLRMSREDIRQETKDADGDPRVKARLRQLRQARARKRMLSAVKRATVVVTNPTHYAVALSYDRTKAAAPRVVAKGVDLMAARIREAARDNGVAIVANPPLARALYRVELDAEIPADHYKAVAELIAYVWRLRDRRRRTA
jgi:flagellar biosynthetic protein FlhB